MLDTLIELYDERPAENVLSTEVFQPKRTVFLCPSEWTGSNAARRRILRYFRHRSLSVDVIFRQVNRYSAESIVDALGQVLAEYPEAVLDVTGGSETALFAAGLCCAKVGLPALTYSRKRNCFFSIYKADFAQGLPCLVQHRVEDCFYMAGGSVRQGRVDNAILSRYHAQYTPFFHIFIKHQAHWPKMVQFFQRASQDASSLRASATLSEKERREDLFPALCDVLQALSQIGFLFDLSQKDGRLSFRFADAQVRSWLRDVGSVLELYVYKTCLDTGLFHDVRTSVVVDWEGEAERPGVTNEIDVMATCGVTPFFISCKTCRVDTAALNELAILRDRFGGQMAHALLITAKPCRSLTRLRAGELGIHIIDINDLAGGRLGEVLSSFVHKQ